MKKIYFITSNSGKVLEVKNKLIDLDLTVIQKNLGYPEIQSKSLKDVAKFGVQHVQKRLKFPFILEDAGLFIEGLGGFPGVFSAYVFHTIGCDGILKLMKGMEGKDRKAIFRSVFAYAEPVKKPILFVGECHGTISENMRGRNGFGYDPIFIPGDGNKTFGEMSTSEKNKLSHRGKSLEKLADYFKNI
jgi:XTP/dITP diphosphohydrolase